MKKIIIGSVLLGALLSISSCSKIVYTHEQVMLSYRTKEAVIKQFGLPDEKREANGITEWVYDCDSVSSLGSSKTMIAIDGRYNGVTDSLKTKTQNVDRFTDYRKYIKFTFDQAGTVLKWDSHGVNFAEKKSNTVGTVLLIVGSTAVLLLAIAAASFNLDGLTVW